MAQLISERTTQSAQAAQTATRLLEYMEWVKAIQKQREVSLSLALSGIEETAKLTHARESRNDSSTEITQPAAMPLGRWHQAVKDALQMCEKTDDTVTDSCVMAFESVLREHSTISLSVCELLQHAHNRSPTAATPLEPQTLPILLQRLEEMSGNFYRCDETLFMCFV